MSEKQCFLFVFAPKTKCNASVSAHFQSKGEQKAVFQFFFSPKQNILFMFKLLGNKSCLGCKGHDVVSTLSCNAFFMDRSEVRIGDIILQNDAYIQTNTVYDVGGGLHGVFTEIPK